MKYQAIIFDMDGTLLDTLEDITDSVNFVMGGCGYPPKSKEEIQKNIGSGALHLLEQSFPCKLSAEQLKHTAERYKRHYLENCTSKTKPYPQTTEVLHHLRQKGIKLGIVSNKPDAMVKHLNEVFFKDYISVALGEMPGVNRKPEPDLVLSALRQLGAGPDSALYAGDSEVDIMTAKNAGIPCVSVTWGFRGIDALAAAGADIIIRQPLELLEHL